jgi:mono/diheme cytochrome c family protein
MKWHIALGLGSIFVLLAVLGYVAINEQDRMENFTVSYESRQIERGASLFETNCLPCHGPQGRGVEGVAPALNSADLFNGQRLQSIGFAGTLEDYLRGVISAGRPVPSEGATYPERMPTWGQENGGPLRSDQIENLVAFIANWEETALAEASGQPTPPPSGNMMGEDIQISLPKGDPERGKTLAEGPFGCVGCHILTETGPSWQAQGDTPGIGSRASTRISEEDYTGTAENAVQYLLESIVQPNTFVVEGFAPNIMPPNFGDRVTIQDAADLIAYLQTFQ